MMSRVIGRLVFKDLSDEKETDVDLSTMNNVESIKAYLNPDSKHEAFNMEEFAFALKVELEHGKIKDVNVTNNHPFLTAMIALAHMKKTNGIRNYSRLKKNLQKQDQVWRNGLQKWMIFQPWKKLGINYCEKAVN